MAVAGCGGDDSSGSNGVESKPADQIVADAAEALSKVKSFHAEGSEGNSKLAVDIEVPDKVRIAIQAGATSATIIGVDGSAYIRANEAYWKDQNVGRAAPQLADKWLKSPSTTAELKDLTKGLDPETLSRCLTKDHGTIAKGEQEQVDGEDAIVVLDKGDRPGTSPGKLYVATTGEPLPLRTIATGDERPGGKADPLCDSDNSKTKKGDTATFSRYNESLGIKAPAGAIDLAGAGTQS